MKTLVIYDSWYGNTEKIAKAIGDTLHGNVIHQEHFKKKDLQDIDLLIMGSPVHGGRATPELEQVLKQLPDLQDIFVTAFDTRFATKDHGIGLRILMDIIRFAAERMAKELVHKGGHLMVKPEGFIVKDKEGPLEKGELERAVKWAKKIELLINGAAVLGKKGVSLHD